MHNPSLRPSCFGTAIVAGVLVAILHAHGGEIKPTNKELRTERTWLKAHLLNARPTPSLAEPIAQPAKSLEPGLEVVANNDAVTQNGRGVNRMKIGDREFTRGLYCHAVSRVEVRLPGPGKTFRAIVGLDHNEDTARGKGSVVFMVKIKGRRASLSSTATRATGAPRRASSPTRSRWVPGAGTVSPRMAVAPPTVRKAGPISTSRCQEAG